MVDVASLAGEVNAKRILLDDNLLQIGIQDQLIELFQQQIKDLKDNQLIPTDFTLSTSISALIVQYNALILKKQNIEPQIGKNSLILKDLNTQISVAYNAILTGLFELKKIRILQKNSLNKRLSEQQNKFLELPSKEQTLVEIKRQQNVKEGLYLYLLQKREETAITSATHINNFEQLELANGYQIAPVSKNIYLYAISLGLLFPVGFIFLKDYFNDKINNRNDIILQTKIPIIADIGHSPDSNIQLIVADKSRNLVAEQFRILRTNLSFLIQDNKTILVTSSMSGEGKSFIALNLAAVFAISNKKVALLEFDLRKPRIIKNIGAPKKKIGLSNYLAKQTDSLDDLFYRLDNYPTLHVYGCGPIPPNPSELMTGDRIKQLFDD